jgi:hypothetical protein
VLGFGNLGEHAIETGIAAIAEVLDGSSACHRKAGLMSTPTTPRTA